MWADAILVSADKPRGHRLVTRMGKTAKDGPFTPIVVVVRNQGALSTPVDTKKKMGLPKEDRVIRKRRSNPRKSDYPTQKKAIHTP